MSYKNVPFGSPEKFNVVVEIPKGSEVKYEYDEALDVIKVDWIFERGFSFPFDYGYVPGARGGDGDLLDAFVVGSRSIALGTVVECRALGIMEVLDRGEQDDKLIAVPVLDPASEPYKELSDLPFDYKKIFEDFFLELAIQRNKIVAIQGFSDAATALRELAAARQKFG